LNGPPVTYRHELSKAQPRVLYYDEVNGAHRAVIQATVEMPKADLALCKIAFPDDVPPNVQFATRLVLDSAPVEFGERIFVIGYFKMRIERTGNEGNYKFNGQWLLRSGSVTKVFPRIGRLVRSTHAFK
jgi:hypothetical protein